MAVRVVDVDSAFFRSVDYSFEAGLDVFEMLLDPLG